MSIQAFISLGLPYVVALVVGLLVPLVAVSAFKSFAVGVWLIALSIVVEAAVTGTASLNLGVSVYPMDLVMGLLGLVALLRFLSMPDARPRHAALYLLLAVYFLNLLHGIVLYKAAAGPPARLVFYAYCAISYAAVFRHDEKTIRAAFNALVGGALLMLCVVIYRVLITALDVRELLPPSGSFQPRYHSIWRVVNSNESLLLAEAMLALWGAVAVSRNWRSWRWLVPVLLLATIGLQHRSVWVATMAGMFALWAVGRRVKGGAPGGSWVGVTVGAAIVVAVAVIAASRGDGVTGDVAKSARDAIELKGTAGDRLGSWKQLIKHWAEGGPRVWVAGQPYGTSMERYTSDELGARKVAFQPHNYYVELLVTQGLVGLCAFLALCFTALRKLWGLRNHEQMGHAARFLLMLVVCQMAYYTTYGIDYTQSVFFGLGLALATQLGSVKAKVPPVMRPWVFQRRLR